jgi:hypothetical protein
MSRREVRFLLALAVAAPLALLAGRALGLGADWLLAVPVVLLALPLLHGRYLGEERIARLRAARERPRRRRAPADAGLPRRAPRGLLPRGGSLLAFSLSVRPPPAAAASC